jgi:hypothetical protein
MAKPRWSPGLSAFMRTALMHPGQRSVVELRDGPRWARETRWGWDQRSAKLHECLRRESSAFAPISR